MTKIERARAALNKAHKKFATAAGRLGGLSAAETMTPQERTIRARKAQKASVLARRRNKGVKA